MEVHWMKREYRYFDLILGAFVAVLLISNIASTKIIGIPLPSLFGKSLVLSFDGGTILFPISYIFGDILTEVYGFERSRRVIWSGFFGLALMSLTIWLVGVLPSAAGWEAQEAYQQILMTAPRIAGASMVAYFVGELLNSFVMSKMKIRMQGKRLWVRTIGSTIVGQLVDTVLFVGIAFGGILPVSLLWDIAIFNYIFKIAFEIVITPLTYKIVGWLKRVENEDKYDYDADYNPFKLS
jgi:hypothetical protein